MCGIEVASHKYVVTGLEGSASALAWFEYLKVVVVTSDVGMSCSALEHSREALPIQSTEVVGGVDCLTIWRLPISR